MGYTNPTGISFMERRILLELERQGECHPWQLANDCKEPISKQGIYTQLNRLEDKGMVSSRRLRNPDAVKYPYRRRHYRITEQGQRALKAWDAAVAAVG